MEDYSRFFKYPEAFITDIESNNQKIKLTLSSDVLEYPLTKENINYFYKRLEEQYIKVVNHINEVSKNKKSIFFFFLAIILGAISYFGNSSGFESVFITFGTGSVLSLSGILINEAVVKPNNKKRLNVYKDFLEYMNEFSQAIEKDRNILSISKSSNKVLEQERKLQSDGLIEEAININFMDKANIDDLKSMSKRLKIYQALNLPVIFISEKEETKDVKIRTKKQ